MPDPVCKPSTSARVIGGIELVVGTFEMTHGLSLVFRPDPTLASQLVGGALAFHGADTMAAGARTIVSGCHTETVTTGFVRSALAPPRETGVSTGPKR